jgi:hypothetical protein
MGLIAQPTDTEPADRCTEIVDRCDRCLTRTGVADRLVASELHARLLQRRRLKSSSEPERVKKLWPQIDGSLGGMIRLRGLPVSEGVSRPVWRDHCPESRYFCRRYFGHFTNQEWTNRSSGFAVLLRLGAG